MTVWLCHITFFTSTVPRFNSKFAQEYCAKWNDLQKQLLFFLIIFCGRICKRFLQSDNVAMLYLFYSLDRFNFLEKQLDIFWVAWLISILFNSISILFTCFLHIQTKLKVFMTILSVHPHSNINYPNRINVNWFI